MEEIIKKPKVEDYDLQPYGYINALQKYIDYLEAKFNNVDLGSVSICDIDHCSKPSENETDAGNLCEKHYDDYFQALDNASVC